MNRSLNIGTYAGIPVKLHWTFGLLVISLVFFGIKIGLDGMGMVWFLSYIFCLFLCVVLHEYGHALMARRFNVKTKDIILSPIGGLARLEHIPRVPKHELLIAIAGPLVNVVIALCIFILIYFLGDTVFSELIDFPKNIYEFLRLVFWLNIVLFLFNLIPAFPMDGGRILRALLAIKLDYNKATLIASIIGRVFAVLFVIYAVFSKSFVLGLIGVFIYYMAKNENMHVKRISSLTNTLVKDLANYNFNILYDDEPLRHALELRTKGLEFAFVVKNRFEEIIGSLPEQFADYVSKQDLQEKPIASMTSPKIGYITEETTILDVFKKLDREALGILAVKRQGEIVAVIDRHIVKTFLKSL